LSSVTFFDGNLRFSTIAQLLTSAFNFSMKVTELSKACKRFDFLCNEEKALCKLLQEKEAKPPSDVYLAAKDRQVLK